MNSLRVLIKKAESVKGWVRMKPNSLGCANIQFGGYLLKIRKLFGITQNIIPLAFNVYVFYKNRKV